MNDEEKLEEMYKDFLNQRRELRKEVTWTATQSIKSSPSVINFDFASFYTSTITMHFPSKQSRRKKKINKIFGL